MTELFESASWPTRVRAMTTHRWFGFQDYLQVTIHLGPTDENSNEEETS